MRLVCGIDCDRRQASIVTIVGRLVLVHANVLPRGRPVRVPHALEIPPLIPHDVWGVARVDREIYGGRGDPVGDGFLLPTWKSQVEDRRVVRMIPEGEPRVGEVDSASR